MSLDRLRDNELTVTQELIANMPGARRESVTEAARKLQRAVVIRCARDHVNFLDRTGLELRSGESYAFVEKAYARLLPKRSTT